MNTRAIWIAGLGYLLPLPAAAHGFAQRYDLPVPLTLYISGSAAAVALSFVVIAIFVRARGGLTDYPRFNLLTTAIGRALASSLLIGLCRFVTLGLMLLVIAAGLFGNPNPFKNIAPTTVWVIWWVGFAYLSGLVGNLWAVINPWATAFDLSERLARLIKPSARVGRRFAYPGWLGDWPAVLLLLGFVWAELVWPNSDVPSSLAVAIIIYSLITWLGMFLFGKYTWLRHGEAFSVLFGLLARFAPTEVRVTNNTVCASCDAAACQHNPSDCINCYECFDKARPNEREWNLRPWAVGLVVERPISVSCMAFVIVMLASVTFDGILATPLWATVAEWMLFSPGFRPLVLVLQDITGNAIAAVSTIAMCMFIVTFTLSYLAFSFLMRRSTPQPYRDSWTTGELARLFVLSLIPIALAYHLAHYLSFLLIVGQYMIPLISDPFGFGWNLFGTKLYFIKIGIVNARFVWITSVIAIVVGHIIAVYIAHVVAMRAFGNNRAALLSQMPMLILMVAYTMISLWILAQPVVETG